MNPTTDIPDTIHVTKCSSEEAAAGMNPAVKRTVAERCVDGDSEDDGYPSAIRRKSQLRLKSENVAIMSPITEISFSMSTTVLGTPTSTSQSRAITSSNVNEEANTSASNGAESDDSSGTLTEDNENSTEGLIASRNPSAFRIRRLNMDFNDDRTTMAVDDSFFDDRRDNRQFYPLSANANLLSPEGSPERYLVFNSNAPIFTKLRSLDEISSNSVDSGYGPYPATNSSIEPTEIRDTKTIATVPITSRSLSNALRYTVDNINKLKTFNSLSSDSMDSIDDDYMDLFDMETLDNDEQNKNVQQRPSNLNSLISGHIKTVRSTPEMRRPTVRRCLSLNDNSNAIRALHTVFEPKTPEILRSGQENLCESSTPFSSRLNAERCFKRPDPPSTSTSPNNSKRCKTDHEEKENNNNIPSDANNFRQLRKSVSMNENEILSALSRSATEPELIGDFSRPYLLPTMDGRHHDLKSISSETLANIINGKYSNTIASYKIIDCRYPYEFEGGHIRGALNLYTFEHIFDELVKTKTDEPTVVADGPKRNILIFHCEFSSERGPKLSRFLRNQDRTCNSTSYPALRYPEIYLLHGGYKEFFQDHSELCDPIAYRTMLDPSYGNDLKHFRSKSKSWSGDFKSFGGSSTQRIKKSRSRLVL